VKRKADGIATPRQAAVVRIVWQDERGKPVRRDKPTFASYHPGDRPIPEPEFPADQGSDAQGWAEIGAVYHVPPEAARAVVELQYRWAPKGRVAWADVSLEETATPPPRRVRLATVHLRPAKGTTNAEKCAQFAAPIEEAAKRGADLVVLPETLTYFSTK